MNKKPHKKRESTIPYIIMLRKGELHDKGRATETPYRFRISSYNLSLSVEYN